MPKGVKVQVLSSPPLFFLQFVEISVREYIEKMPRINPPAITKVGTIFGNDYPKLKIPRFQRPYVWEEEQLDAFWEDFVQTKPDSLNFLGVLIFSRGSSGFDVVDGQQRLLTISVFVAALKSVWIEKIEDDSFSRFMASQLYSEDVYADKGSRSISARLELDPSIKNKYEELLKDGGIAGTTRRTDQFKPILEAFSYFRDRLLRLVEDNPNLKSADIERILKEHHRRLFDVDLILISLDEESDAYEMFESFNAKGVELKVADLLKNLILSRLPQDASSLDRAEQKWKFITKVVTSSVDIRSFNLSSYIRYFWVSQHAYLNERDLYRSIKHGTTDYAQFLNNLYRTAQKLETIFGADPRAALERLGKKDFSAEDIRHMTEIMESIKSLKIMRVQSFIVWLIAILNQPEVQLKWLRNSLASIENFAFQYFAIGKKPANRIERLFSELSLELESAPPASEQHVINNRFKIILEERNLIPSKEEFTDDFLKLKKQASNGPFIKYLFSKIERHSHGTRELDINSDEVNIEHLMPENPDHSWGLSSADIKNYVQNLGNLTIIDFRINSSIKNAEMRTKIEGRSTGDNCIKKSQLEINKRLVESLRAKNYLWNEDKIKDRQKELCTTAYSVWPIG